jgi:hypothetical protein
MGVARLAAHLASIEDAARNGRALPATDKVEELRALLEATLGELIGTFGRNEPARLSA